MKNNWDRTIKLSAPPYVILKKDVGPSPKVDRPIHTLKWEKFYEPNTTQVIYLNPGDERTWEWDQRGVNNTQVSIGRYKVVFSVVGWAEGTYSDWFIIDHK